MKIALVHDYLREYGGAERVVEVLHEMWPEAPLYTSFVDWHSFAKAPAGKVKLFQSMDIRTSWIQHNPIVKKFHSPLRFLAPKIWESFDLSAYDVVISSSGWFISRGVKVKPPSVHICYIHHPPRNLWGYPTGSTLQKYAVVRGYANVINFFLRHYDIETAQKVDYFIANSKETARRVWKFYRRESTVIYPPVTLSNKIKKRLTMNDLPRRQTNQQYYLSVGRLAWAKRIDLAIQACNSLKLPLKIVGTGKEEEYLRSGAGPTIEFAGGVSDSKLDELYRGAKALIFTALDEDFGIVPVEAMGRGVPVIGLAQGGVKETVADGKTGILFDTPDEASLVAALKRFEKMKKDWTKPCQAQAEIFEKDVFMKKLRAFVEEKYRAKK